MGRRVVRTCAGLMLEEEGRIWRKQAKCTLYWPGGIPVELLEACRTGFQRTSLLEVSGSSVYSSGARPELRGCVATSGKPSRSCSSVMLNIGKGQPDDRDLNELWDSAFHRAIAEAAGNRLMLGLFDAIDAVPARTGLQHLRELARTPERVDSYNDHHHKDHCLRLSIAALMNQLPPCANNCSACKTAPDSGQIHLEDDFTL